jgi:hypothetical protein
MRYKGLSVCLVALFVFFGLRSFMRTVEPQPPSRLAMLEDGTRGTPSRTHLASLASLAAGALAFAVIPGRRRSSADKAPGPMLSRTHLASLAAGALAFLPVRRRSSAPKPAAPASAQEPVVRCPQCDRTMSRVLIANGEHRGRTVWLCPQSPDCEVRPLTRRRRLSFMHRAS